MTKPKHSPTPLAEDAAPLELPESEETPGVVEIAAIEGDNAPEAPLVTAPMPDRETPVPVASDGATRHILDLAPPNSKIVVVRVDEQRKAVLATAGAARQETVLPANDPASKLPVGAVIRKVREGHYEARQLDPAIEYPNLVANSAGEAIRQFVPYFHRPTE